jgi:hypothetical protein
MFYSSQATGSPLATMSAPTDSEARAELTPFPDPSTFAILPDVYLLLSRVALLQQQSTNGAAASLSGEAQHSNPLNLTPLEVKDLTAAIYPLRQKVQKAKEAVTGLVGVEHSIQEQEAEIRALEARIQALKQRVTLLGDIAGNGLKEEEEVVMDGVEHQRSG